MMVSSPVIFFDLHGVLINTSEMGKQYGKKLAEILRRDFNILESIGVTRHETAFSEWIQEFRSWKDILDNELRERSDAALVKWTQTLLDQKSPPIDLLRHGEKLEYDVARSINAIYTETIPVLQKIERIYPNSSLGVASSAHTRHIRGILEANMITQYFKWMIGYDTFWVPKKNLAYYQRIMAHTKSPNTPTIFVGDSQEEVKHSQSAGFIPILVERNPQAPTVTSSNVPYIIPDLGGLFPILKNIV